MATFTWNPDSGADEQHEPSARRVKFGDGYEQRSANGLNPDMASLDGLTFSGRSAAESAAIETFLRAQGSVTSFNWTPPGGTQGIYVCSKWSKKWVSSLVVITASFYQVPM